MLDKIVSRTNARREGTEAAEMVANVTERYGIKVDSYDLF